MSRYVAVAIENWFCQHSDDVEFVRLDRDYPYQVIGPTSESDRIIFATKSTIFKAYEHRATQARFGLIARYGLPSSDDVDWLTNVIGDRALLFLGDMDPVDLMVFA
jgi:hypothetical protein